MPRGSSSFTLSPSRRTLSKKSPAARAAAGVLGLDKLDCTVAILKNVTSGKLGRKDIIKIDREMDLDWDLIGYVDPTITVNIIHEGQLREKRSLKLPERIRGVLKCKNPRCITSVEQELPQEFLLTDPAKRVYRCIYCETEAGK